MHMGSSRHIGTVIALALLAGALWAGWWYAGDAVAALRDARLAARQQAMKTADDRAMRVLASSAAADTAEVRARLDTLVHADVVSAAALVESAGKSTGASIHVSDVAAGVDRDPKIAAATGVHAVMFSLEASGTFGQVFATIERLETLPLPVQVEQFSLAPDPAATGKTARWHLTARLRLLTAAAL